MKPRIRRVFMSGVSGVPDGWMWMFSFDGSQGYGSTPADARIGWIRGRLA